MTARASLLAALALALLGPSAAAGGEVRSSALRWRADDRGPFGTVAVTHTAAPPADVERIAEPGEIRFAARDFGTRRLLAAITFDEPVRIRVDADFDGDLRNDEPVHLAGAGTTLSATVEVDAGDGETKVPLLFIHHHNPGSRCLHLSLRARREGSIVVAGRERRVALLDGNADLRFDDAEHDALLLDVDGDGDLNAGAGTWERIVPGQAFRLGDAGWVASLVEDRLVLAPADPVPAAAPRPWVPARPPSAGVVPRGEGTLEGLAGEHRAAEEADRKQGPNVTTGRLAVLARIGQLGTPEAGAWLLRQQKGEADAGLRAAAIRALGYRPYVTHADAVAAIATGGAPATVRGAALAALHGMDAPGRGAILRDLVAKEKDAYVFGQAATHLAYLGGEEAWRALEAAALSHAVPSCRLAAFQTSRYRPDSPPAPLVLAAARSDDPALRAAALGTAFERGLAEASDLAREALAARDVPETVLRAAVRILGSSGDAAAAGSLFDRAETLPESVRGEIVALLRPVRGAPAVALLVGRLSARSAAERTLAADVLAGIPGPEVLAGLLERLGAERVETARAAILRALGERDEPRAARAVLDAVDPARASSASLDAALRALARAGLADPEVMAFFRKALASRDVEKRVVAVAAAAGSGDLAAADLLLGAIADEAWTVRLVAVEGLGRIRVKRAVPPLIERLEQEESPRIRQAAAEALFLVTGENLYDLPDLWRRWWKEHGDAFEVPSAVPSRAREGRADGSVASFYGIPVESDRIVFVLDQSGSMSGSVGTQTKLERAVDETLAVLEKLPARAQVNVILFETAVHAWQPRLVKLTKAARVAIAKHLRAQRPTGGTNLYDAVEMAILTEGVDTIYLLSDGAPGQGKFVQREDILREVARLNRTRRIAIHCVSVGMDSPLLRDLADQNGGQCVRR